MQTSTCSGLRHQACPILQTFGRPKFTFSTACGMSSSPRIPTMTLLLLRSTCTAPTVAPRYSTGKMASFLGELADEKQNVCVGELGLRLMDVDLLVQIRTRYIQPVRYRWHILPAHHWFVSHLLLLVPAVRRLASKPLHHQE